MNFKFQYILMYLIQFEFLNLCDNELKHFQALNFIISVSSVAEFSIFADLVM